jgi:hypothetical protein
MDGIGDVNAGHRVVMTEAALKQRLQGRKNRTTGVILKITDRGLRILRDGRGSPENWSPEFWRKDNQSNRVLPKPLQSNELLGGPDANLVATTDNRL